MTNFISLLMVLAVLVSKQKQIVLGGDSDIQLHVDIRGKELTDLCTGLHSQSISGNDDVDVGAKWNFRSATVSPEKINFILCSATFHVVDILCYKQIGSGF
jgi:hypothetical protein